MQLYPLPRGAKPPRPPPRPAPGAPAAPGAPGAPAAPPPPPPGPPGAPPRPAPGPPAPPRVHRSDLRSLPGDLPRLLHRHAFRSVGVAARVLVPVDGDRRQAPARLELVLDREHVRERVRRQRVFLYAPGADEGLRAQRERPVGGAEDVHTPVTDQAAAEVVEPAPVEREVEAEVLATAEAAAPPCACGSGGGLSGGPRRQRAGRRLRGRACGAPSSRSAAGRDEVLVLLIADGERAERGGSQPQVP